MPELAAPPPLAACWPEDLLQEVDRCPACGCGSSELLYSGLTDVVFRCAPGRWNLYRCLVCRSLYLNPRPSPAGIALAYRTYYTHAPAPGRAGSSRFRMLLTAVKNGYINACLGTGLAPAHWLGRWLVPAALPFAFPGVRLATRHLGKPRPGERFFDVGAGAGDWLAAAEGLGWWACGVDPDRHAAVLGNHRSAPGIRARLPDLPIADHAAGAVLLSHVFEHLHEPAACLREVARLLRPGGTLLMAMPNADSLLHRRYGPHWFGLDVPRHLVIFTRDALSNILAVHGLEARGWLRPSVLDAYRENASLNLACGRDWSERASLGLVAGGAAIRALWAWCSPSRVDELIVAAVKR